MTPYEKQRELNKRSEPVLARARAQLCISTHLSVPRGENI